jgi:SpoVK/Ycf46/Vps4 family AAA+-type ATPase
MSKMNVNRDEIDLTELCKQCVNFSGADVKSVMCDALVKAFHRIKGNLQLEPEESLKIESHEDLVELIRIENYDLISSVESIRESINASERARMRIM